MLQGKLQSPGNTLSYSIQGFDFCLHACAARAANCCSWFERGLPFYFFILRLMLRDFHFIKLPFFLLVLTKGIMWRGWMPCLLCASYCLTHPLRGWGIVDERRTETVDRVAGYQTAYDSRENPAMLLVPQTAAATWRVPCSSACLLFPLALSLTPFVRVYSSH